MLSMGRRPSADHVFGGSIRPGGARKATVDAGLDRDAIVSLTLDPAFVAALATLLTAMATLLTALRTNSKAQATQRTIAHVHKKVDEATNGQHAELVHDIKALDRRIEVMEGELNTIYKAFVEQIERRGKAPLRWRGDR